VTQLTLFGRLVAVEKPPEKLAEVADITWEQFTAWRKAPFTCEWCGKPAIHAGSSVVGPWRIHLTCEREAAQLVVADAIKQARSER
jgi:hypothetical protein